MASALDTLDAYFFGDLAQDTHGAWEVYEFVRFHYRLGGRPFTEMPPNAPALAYGAEYHA
jgi:hypothetical protein